MQIVEPLTEESFKFLIGQSEDYLENIEEIAQEMVNVIGEMRTKRLLERTGYLDDMMIDHINPGLVETEVLFLPTRAWVFIKEFPPHLKQYHKTKFSKDLGLMGVRKRWQMYMLVAMNELRQKKCPSFPGEAVVLYNFHFPKERTDPDGMTAHFITNSWRDGGFITDDASKHLTTIIKGAFDPKEPGTEIMLLNKDDFKKYAQALL